MSTLTRKDLVLQYLKAHPGWVNGPELASPAVGGSEGLKRLRELRADGYPIERRRHPDKNRAVWQYRLAGAIPHYTPVDLGQQMATKGGPIDRATEQALEAHDVLPGVTVITPEGTTTGTLRSDDSIRVDAPKASHVEKVSEWNCPKCGRALDEVKVLFGNFAMGLCPTHRRVQARKP